MVPSSNVLYNPAEHSAPNPLLPEEVFGHVDLETLANIHRYLCESELQEDIELATWIWENYLNGLWNGSPTAEIRTAQGFSKLDRAYRRVRSLTNKAQDKWPFFDRNFKQMSSATVRNNARGEAAPGIMYPIDSLQRKSHLAGQPPDGSTTPNTSSAPELQVPFGTARSSRYQLHMQNHPHPTRQTPAPLPSNLPEKSSEPSDFENLLVALGQLPSSVVSSPDIAKYTDLFSESDGQAKPQSEPPRSDVPQIKRAFDQDMSQEEPEASSSTPVDGTVSRRSISKPIEDPEVEPPVRDAGAGKVRGPNGRYLPRHDIVPGLKGPKKPKQPKKGVTTRTGTRSVEKRESSVPKAAYKEPAAAPTQDEETLADVQPPSPLALGQEVEDQIGVQEETNVFPATGIVAPPATDVVVPPETVDEQEFREEEITSHPGPVPAYLLAAEAEAVPSSLDRLPPNSTRSNKRKSEPAAQSGDRKRGKHGGIVGRPRKSEQRKGKEAQQELVPPQEETTMDVDEPPQINYTNGPLLSKVGGLSTTRRATRRSAVTSLNNPHTSKSTAKPQTDVPVERLTHTSKKPPKVPLNPDKMFAEHEDEMMGGVGEYVPTPDAIGVRATPSSTLKGSLLPPQVSDNRLLKVGVDGTTSPTLPQPASRPQPEQSRYQPIESPPPSAFVAKDTTDNGAEFVYLPGHVEYFARITTGTGGTMNLPIEENQLESDEVRMIKKYAQYNAEAGVVPVSYMQFRQIFAFAKQD